VIFNYCVYITQIILIRMRYLYVFIVFVSIIGCSETIRLKLVNSSTRDLKDQP
jgi:hypothetical protein